MSTVSASPNLWSLVNLNVLHNTGLSIQALSHSISLSVEEQLFQELDALHGPSSLVSSEFLGLACSSHGAVEAQEWDATGVSNDFCQVLECLVDFHSFDGHGGFVHVLEVGAQVRGLSLAGLGHVLGSERVGHLPEERVSGAGWMD